jgi:vitamin-K-epoxide reductase (warfarin-sensitive)
MRYSIVVLSILGMVVSALALYVHYSYNDQLCDVNAHWDCSTVNHDNVLLLVLRTHAFRN